MAQLNYGAASQAGWSDQAIRSYAQQNGLSLINTPQPQNTPATSTTSLPQTQNTPATSTSTSNPPQTERFGGPVGWAIDNILPGAAATLGTIGGAGLGGLAGIETGPGALGAAVVGGATGGAIGGGAGEGLRDWIQGVNPTPSDIGTNAIVGGLGGGIGEGIGKLGLPLLAKAGSKLPVVGPLVQQLSRSGESLLERIFGTGGQRVGMDASLPDNVDTVKVFKINNGSSNPQELMNRADQAGEVAKSQRTQILANADKSGQTISQNGLDKIIQNSSKEISGQDEQNALNDFKNSMSDYLLNQSNVGGDVTNPAVTEAESMKLLQELQSGTHQFLPSEVDMLKNAAQDIAHKSYNRIGTPAQEAMKGVAANLRKWLVDNVGNNYAQINQHVDNIFNPDYGIISHLNGIWKNGGRVMPTKGFGIPGIPGLSAIRIGAADTLGGVQAHLGATGIIPAIGGQVFAKNALNTPSNGNLNGGGMGNINQNGNVSFNNSQTTPTSNDIAKSQNLVNQIDSLAAMNAANPITSKALGNLKDIATKVQAGAQMTAIANNSFGLISSLPGLANVSIIDLYNRTQNPAFANLDANLQSLSDQAKALGIPYTYNSQDSVAVEQQKLKQLQGYIPQFTGTVSQLEGYLSQFMGSGGTSQGVTTPAVISGGP